jgi:hypothetical protein
VNRCATQNQVRDRLFPQPAKGTTPGSEIRFPAFSFMLAFNSAGPYLAGLTLGIVLALASMAVPAATVHLLVELVSVNGTAK